MKPDITNVAFLGVCERSTRIREGQPLLWKYDILGLKQAVLSHVYPLNIKGFQLAFAIYGSAFSTAIHIRVLAPTTEELFHIDLNPQFPVKMDSIDSIAVLIPRTEIGAFVPRDYSVWSFFITELNGFDALVKEPGDYKVVVSTDEGEKTIGFLVFGYVPAPPLTEERIAAIRSNPHASKWIHFTLRCNECGTELRSYTGLERNVKDEHDGWIWHRELASRFICECEKTKIDLTYIRESLHALLGQVVSSNEEEMSFTRLYEKHTLELICNQFAAALVPDPKEETVQQFIENNPILLQQFAPQKVYHKPPLLTKYTADFAVLNNKGELILIEIEKPNKRLLKKDGGISAEFQHAIDQVRDWLHLVEEHRAAALECIGLKPEEVVSIRGVVIMGRDGSCSPSHLRKLKWTDFGQRITFYTYNDLISGLVTLVRTIKDL
jgi:hypothetical protein